MVRDGASVRATGILVLIACSLMCPSLAGPLMAVDLGGEFLKVAVVKPGRIPISIVNNEMSKRRTSVQVAFVDGDRLLGEEAAALSVRFPDQVFARARELLGKPAKHPSLERLLKENQLPYTVVPDGSRAAAAVKTRSGALVSAEELVAALLHYAKKITEAAADGAEVKDCVIAVPPYFGPLQRQAMLDAADLAGLKVMGLINSHAAAALQYGIERDYTNKTDWVVLYDQGASDTVVALVRYSSFTIKEYGKPKTYSQFEVRDVVWEEGLGAGQLDLLLTQHFANEFKSKTGQDISAQPKAIAKLKRQVKRTKEILSANTDAPLSVEELHNGLDFRSTITRAAFEKLAGSFFDKAVEPLRGLLQRNRLTPQELHAVEVLGGGSRVPALQAALSRALGGRSLDKHLDADEAVVLGAALFAANLSTTFRLRKFGMMDGATYAVSLHIQPPPKSALAKPRRPGDDPADPLYQAKTLLPFMKKLPAKRLVHLPNTSADSLSFTLSFDESRPLPPATDKPLFASFEVSGMREVVKKHPEPAKMGVHFRADLSGILAVDRAEAVIDTLEQYEVQVPVNESSNASTVIPPQTADSTDSDAAVADEDSSEDASQAPASSESEKSQAEPTEKSQADEKAKAEAPSKTAGQNATSKKTETVIRTRKKVYRVPLKLGGSGFVSGGMSSERKQEAKKAMAEVLARDVAKAETAASKNELESYIISTREALEEEEVAAVTTPDERGSFQTLLTETEDWLYMEGEAEPAATFRSKLKDLKKLGDPIFFRRAERMQRPRALAAARKLFDAVRADLSAWPSSRPWLNATHLASALQEVEEAKEWLEKEAAKQAGLLDTETPSLTSDAITSRARSVEAVHARLKAIKKPKPAPAPKAKPAAGDEKAESGGKAESEKEEAGGQAEGEEKAGKTSGNEEASSEDNASSEGRGTAEDPESAVPHDEL